MITECKCGNPVEAKLDLDTNKIMCQSCGEEIENMSDFAKARMKQEGDVVRDDALHKVPEGGMQVECVKCQKSMVALLNKKDDKAYCPKCGEKQKLSSYATALLRENGQYEGMIKEDDKGGDDLDLESESGEDQPTVPQVKAGVVTVDANGGMPVVRAPEDAEEEGEITSIPPTKVVLTEVEPEPVVPKVVEMKPDVEPTKKVATKKKKGRPAKKKK
jgi:DNA-directed RNA polymerase subunit M/transcription elongation factor TFIIS